jgi:probable HAF family extracellular repeat protein
MTYIGSRAPLQLSFVLIVSLVALPYALGQHYAVRDLGTLQGGSGVPRSLNLYGTVVGRSGEPHGEGTSAFRWDAAHGMRTLGYLPGGDYSAAFSINNAGQVVGYSNTSTHLMGFLWTAASGATSLPPLATDDSCKAFAINSSGEVVGSSSGSKGTRAVVWVGSAIQNIGTLPGDSTSEAYGINSSGQVVGKSSGNGKDHAFLWSNGRMRDLGVLPHQTNSIAQFINDAGQVVGFSSGPLGTLAFLWDRTQGMQNLGTLPGGDYSQANGVNSAGVVVGTSGNALSTHAFIWDASNGLRDLNGLVSKNSEVSLAGATAINDRGQIVAYGNIHLNHSDDRTLQLDHDAHAGPLHIFLLTPAASGGPGTRK